MKRKRTIAHIHLCYGDNQASDIFYPLNHPIPITGVCTVRVNKLFYSELFFGIMPPDKRLWMKKPPHRLSILTQYGVPISLYFHRFSSLSNGELLSFILFPHNRPR